MGRQIIIYVTVVLLTGMKCSKIHLIHSQFENLEKVVQQNGNKNHAFFLLDLSITNPTNILKKQTSATPAETGKRMAYSWGKKYL